MKKMTLLQEALTRCDIIALQVQQLKDCLLRDESVRINSLAIDREEQGLCVYCGEEIDLKKKVFRGAHEKCYKKVNRLINDGKISEQAAIEKGWILPAERGGRSRDTDDPIQRYLDEAKSVYQQMEKKK